MHVHLVSNLAISNGAPSNNEVFQYSLAEHASLQNNSGFPKRPIEVTGRNLTMFYIRKKLV